MTTEQTNRRWSVSVLFAEREQNQGLLQRPETISWAAAQLAGQLPRPSPGNIRCGLQAVVCRYIYIRT
jgi:hypothetical protein